MDNVFNVKISATSVLKFSLFSPKPLPLCHLIMRFGKHPDKSGLYISSVWRIQKELFCLWPLMPSHSVDESCVKNQHEIKVRKLSDVFLGLRGKGNAVVG